MKKTETMTVTIEIEVHEKIKAMARRQGRSKSNMVNFLLKKDTDRINLGGIKKAD